MANTYKWQINSLDCYVSKNNLDHVAYQIHWTYIGEDESGNTAQCIGAQVLSDPNPETFTAFTDLSEATVISWLESLISEDQISGMKSDIDRKISEKIAPTKYNISLGINPEQVLNPASLDSNTSTEETTEETV